MLCEITKKMQVLKIYDLDDQEEIKPISILSEGQHIIGREKLNCNDKRVSRNHALLIIDAKSIILKSTHINPSFYKPNGGNSIQLVKKDNSITLNDGDQFALLPNMFWFKIRIKNLVLNTLIPNSPVKRSHFDEILDEHKKKKATGMADSDESLDYADITEKEYDETAEKENSKCDLEIVENCTENIQIEEPNSSKVAEDVANNIAIDENDAPKHNANSKESVSDSDEDLEPKDENSTRNEDVIEPTSSTDNIKDDDNGKDNKNLSEPDDSTNNPSTSHNKPKRSRCWYGAKCYRKNPVHKNDFSHPGDEDYDTDPGNDLPDCPFGDTCYRTNIGHRQQYKHKNPPAPKTAVNNANNSNLHHSNADSSEDEDTIVNTKRKRRAATKQKQKYNETPEDDYDFDDPFLNDGSSDDFEPSDDDNDSDWQDSQEVDEESQDTRRLLKEAKKFTKKAK